MSTATDTQSPAGRLNPNGSGYRNALAHAASLTLRTRAGGTSRPQCSFSEMRVLESPTGNL